MTKMLETAGPLGASAEYDHDFFAGHSPGSTRSARRILPEVFDRLNPESVIDVGCGIGTWLTVARELGVDDHLGVDGDYIDRSSLLIEPNRFIAHDLATPLRLDRSFDLAISLEVAEHLPPEAAAGFVESLVNLAPCILFSAAIPGQGGTCHLNERWQDYWAELFSHFGYIALDIVRPRVWRDGDVESYYAQNTLIYISENAMSTFTVSAPEPPGLPLRVVHPRTFTGLEAARHPDNITLREASRQWWRSARRAVARRFGAKLTPHGLEA